MWHLPNDPDTRTTRQLVDIVYRQAGQSRTRLRADAPLLLRGVGLFNPTVRELVEMQYQFEEPFIVDSSKIAAKLGVTRPPSTRPSPTPSPPTARHQNSIPGPAGLRGPGDLC